MARGSYDLAPDEAAYGLALQTARDAVKDALVKASEVPEAYTTPDDAERYVDSEVEELAGIYTQLANMHRNLYTLKPRYPKKEEA